MMARVRSTRGRRGFDLYRHALNKNLHLELPGPLGRVVESFRYRLGPVLAQVARPTFSERVVEYPFVFRALPAPPARILDFGAFEDLLALHLASLGYDVVARDLRGYPFTHPRLSVDMRDVLEGVEPESFDAVVSVSTIEHVGLAESGGTTLADGDRRCVELLRGALRSSGVFLATVPFGSPSVQRGARVYDRRGIAAVFPGFELRVFARAEAGHWEEADPAEAERLTLGGGYLPVRAVACLTLIR
jgi:hypothetical protein